MTSLFQLKWGRNPILRESKNSGKRITHFPFGFQGLTGTYSVSRRVCGGFVLTFLLTLFGCCSETHWETQGRSEENQNNLRTKMDINPAEYRHLPEQYKLCSSNTMLFTTISSGVVARGSYPRSRFVRVLFRNCSGFPGRTPKKAEGMSNKSWINMP